MDDNINTSLALCRILSGHYKFTYNDQTFILKYPGMSIRYAADIFIEEEFDKVKFNEWITQEDILYFLIDTGLWTKDGDTLLVSLEKQVEDYKVELYENYLNPVKIKQIKQRLLATKKNYNRLFNKRHCLDSVTVEGYLNNLKDQYILMQSIYDECDKLIFDNPNNTDVKLLSNLSIYISQNTIDIETFRLLARSSKWKNYWICNKNNLFNKPTIEWTEEQQTLVLMSRMYDNAYEHPECPPDHVIEDDDVFDGWLISNRRQNEKNKQKNRTEKLIKDKKLGNAQEVFFVAQSHEEAQAIYDLNDNNNKNIIRERNHIVMSSSRDIKDSELPDVQRNLTMQMNKQFMQSRKK